MYYKKKKKKKTFSEKTSDSWPHLLFVPYFWMYTDLIFHMHTQMVLTSNLSESDNFRNYFLKSSKSNQMENSSPSIFDVMKCHTPQKQIIEKKIFTTQNMHINLTQDDT